MTSFNLVVQLNSLHFISCAKSGLDYLIYSCMYPSHSCSYLSCKSMSYSPPFPPQSCKPGWVLEGCTNQNAECRWCNLLILPKRWIQIGIHVGGNPDPPSIDGLNAAARLPHPPSLLSGAWIRMWGWDATWCPFKVKSTCRSFDRKAYWRLLWCLYGRSPLEQPFGKAELDVVC